MGMIANEELEQLRKQADIVDVIAHYIPVEKQGQTYQAVCPFHDDHDPSLKISKDKQIYKCFVCQAGGNVFTFVRDFEKIGFVEAVGEVAKLVGFSLSQDIGQKQQPSRFQKEYDLLSDMIQLTKYQLDDPKYHKQKEYLQKRQLTDEIINTFGIGYNPLGNVVATYLQAKGYTIEQMVECNVASVFGGQLKDVFEDRITFPIHDASGHPIAFSARSLNPQNPSKYINTTETKLYSKGNILYNHHRAKAMARKEGKVYLCEGVTDVIAFYRAGVPNAVCSLGTALTSHQIQLLKNLAIKVVFCFDGDTAGQNATFKGAKAAIAAGLNVSVIQNTTGLDPDEYIRQNGQEAFSHFLAQEISWIEFVMQYYLGKTNLQNFSEKKEMVQNVLAEIGQLKDDFDRQYFTNLLSEKVDMHLDAPKQKQQDIPKRHYVTHQVKFVKGYILAEQQLLIYLMQFPNWIETYMNKLGYFLEEVHQQLFLMMMHQYRTLHLVDPMRLLEESQDFQIQQCITSLMASQQYGEPFDESIFYGMIRKVKIEVLKRELEDYRQKLTIPMDKQKQQSIFSKYTECMNSLRALMDEEGN